MNKGSPKPRWYRKVGESYIGKYILVGITYVDHKGNETQRQQMHGVIESADKNGIKIALKGVYEGQSWTMPPDQSAIKAAQPGTYTLKMSGEKIENPDLLSTWVITEPEPEKHET
ncbi:MAG TPA: hypothetical protein VMT12_00525 [Syntrophales bacterium]|nr:hypothetical protein [Syntrophales bacterium]